MKVTLCTVYEKEGINAVLQTLEDWIASNPNFEPLVVVKNSSEEITGVITDGDMRRCLQNNLDKINSVTAKDLSNKNFYSVVEDSDRLSSRDRWKLKASREYQNTCVSHERWNEVVALRSGPGEADGGLDSCASAP